MIPTNLKTVNDIYNYFVQNNAPEMPIIGYNNKTILLSELHEKVDLFTKHLIQLGVRPGVVVGYTMPNCPEIYYLFLAITRLGGCAVPLFHMIPDHTKVEIFKKAKAQLIVTTSQQFTSLKEHSLNAKAGHKIITIDSNPAAEHSLSSSAPDVDLTDSILKQTPPNLPLLIASSSGTTGIPKMVLMTQSNIGSEIHVSIEMAMPLDKDGPESYSVVLAFPLSTAVIIVCIGVLFAGAFSIFSTDVSPVKYLQLASQWKADSLSAPPAYFEGILALPMLNTFDLTSVKRVISGMDFFFPSLLQRLKAKLINLNSFTNGYGLIETSNVFMICKGLTKQELDKPTNKVKLVENIGNEIDVRDENGNSVSIGEDGELYVKGSNVIQGYLGNPKETQRSFQNGWFRTGDIVRNEGDNCINLLGRKKYLIKRGGKSISPIVVQDHINQILGIKNSAVVGVPHPLYGEMIWAFVVNAKNSNIQLKDVMKHCRAKLPNYMVPDQVSFIQEIPRKPGVGKVDFETLKEMANKELSSNPNTQN